MGPFKQPVVRQTYVKRMRGVDVADQKGGTYMTPHRPKNYFWRRVFEQKLMQAVVNAYILFQKWVRLTIICVDDRIVGMKSRGENPTTQVKIKARLDYL